MSHYWFNRQELLQKANDKYHNSSCKEKDAEYHIENKEILKENVKNKYKNLSEEEKEVKGEYGKDRYRNMMKNEKTS